MIRAVAVVWIALLASTARGDEIVQPQDVSAQVFVNAVNTNNQLLKLPATLTSTFDRFDPSLGELTAIEYAWDYRFRVTLDLAGVGSGSGGASGPFQINGTTTFSGGGGGNGDGSDEAGVLIADFSVTGNQTIDPAIAVDAQVLPFLGAPGTTVDLVFAPELSYRATGGTVTLALLAGSSVSLRYVYAPEPAAVLAGSAAWLVLVALSRRSATINRETKEATQHG